MRTTRIEPLMMVEVSSPWCRFGLVCFSAFLADFDIPIKVLVCFRFKQYDQ